MRRTRMTLPDRTVPVQRMSFPARLLQFNLRSVQGYCRYLARWAELSGTAYPLTVRLLTQAFESDRSPEAITVTKEELIEALEEIATLPVEAARV